MKMRQDHGFTIVELLIVIVVIGVLAAISLIFFTGVSDKANIALLQSDLKNAATQLEIYKTSSSDEKYPSSQSSAGVKFSSGITYNYSYRSNNNSYCITATNSANVSYYISSSTKVPTVGLCPFITFASVIGGAGNDYLPQYQSAIQTSDDGYVMSGRTEYSFTGAGEVDMFTTKLSSDGNLAWTKTWGGASTDQSRAIANSNDGGYVITGDTNIYSGGGELFLNKYASNNSLSWSKVWGGANAEYGFGITQDANDNYIIAGATSSFNGGPSNYDAILLKYSSVGNLVCSKAWGTSNASDYANSVTTASDGGYVITGFASSYSAGSTDVFVAKFASDCSHVWTRMWGGGSTDNGASVIRTSDNGYVVVGSTYSFGTGGDALILKYDVNGGLTWARNWGGSSSEGLRSVVQNSDGSLMAIGLTTSYGNGQIDILILKYDINGNLLWRKTWGGSGNDYGSSIIKTSDGGYAISGYTNSYGAGNNDTVLLKMNSSGDIANCSSPMCQTITNGTSGTPSGSPSSPTPVITTLTPTVDTTISGTEITQSATNTPIVVSP